MDNQQDSTARALTFHLAEKHDILVVSLVGVLTKETEEVMRQCNEEIAKSQARSVVLNLLGVGEIDKAGIAELAKFQIVARRKPAEVRVCFLKPPLAAMLNDAGVLRPNELSGDLKAAIVSLTFRRIAS